MTQLQTGKLSQLDFKDPHMPVEATSKELFGSDFVQSLRLTIPEMEWANISTFVKEFRVGADYELLRWAASVSDTELELRSYAQLGDNWDGEGAVAPSQTAIDDALAFLGQRPPDIPLPYPEEGKEGDVGVYWDNPKAKVFSEVSFEGDGTFSYFAVHGVPSEVIKKCGQDGLEATKPWPEDLLQILRKIDSA